MNPREVLLIYDRECPLCDAYCRRVRLNDAAGELRLVNARDGGPIVDEITARGLDIDQGMVLKVGQVWYYGSDAIHALSLMSSPSGLFNRLNYWLFRSRTLSGIFYPVMRSFRNLFLKLLRRTKINNLEIDNNERF